MEGVIVPLHKSANIPTELADRITHLTQNGLTHAAAYSHVFREISLLTQATIETIQSNHQNLGISAAKKYVEFCIAHRDDVSPEQYKETLFTLAQAIAWTMVYTSSDIGRKQAGKTLSRALNEISLTHEEFQDLKNIANRYIPFNISGTNPAPKRTSDIHSAIAIGTGLNLGTASARS